MCLADGLKERNEALPVRVPVRPARRRIQPLTWVVAVAVMPVLLYDVWQMVQDVKQHHAARADDITVNPDRADRGAAPGTPGLTARQSTNLSPDRTT